MFPLLFAPAHLNLQSEHQDPFENLRPPPRCTTRAKRYTGGGFRTLASSTVGATNLSGGAAAQATYRASGDPMNVPSRRDDDNDKPGLERVQP